MKSIRIGNDIRIEWPIVLSGDVSKLQDLDLTVEVRPSRNVVDWHNYIEQPTLYRGKQTVMMNGGMEFRPDMGDGKEHCTSHRPKPPVPPVKLPYHIENNTLIAMWTADRQFAIGDYDIILYAHKNEGGQAVCDQYRFVRLVAHSAQADAPDDSGIEAVITMQPLTLSLSGLSAYEVAVVNGFQGSVEEWLESLKAGKLSSYVSVESIDNLPQQGDESTGYIIGTKLYIYLGTGGDTLEGKYKDVGEFRGPQGAPGSNGKSAYELAVEGGYEGSVEEWLLSLKGRDGLDGENGKDGVTPLIRWNNNRLEQSTDNGKLWWALSDKFNNKLYIKGYVTSADKLPKNALVGDMYGVGPIYGDDDVEQTKPYYQVYVNTVTDWAKSATITKVYQGDTELPQSAENNEIILIKKSTDNYLVYKYVNGSWNMLANLAEIYVEKDDIVNRGDNIFALVQSEIENQYELYERVVSWRNSGTFTSITAGIVNELGDSENAVMSQKAVTDLLNEGYLYAGIATPTKTPSTPKGKVFYIASESGTYTNFGGISLEGELAALVYNTSWTKQSLCGLGGYGNMILDWNTDYNTTRLQVLSKYRKPGLHITYKHPTLGWINEQSTISDEQAGDNRYWGLDVNWQKILISKDFDALNEQDKNYFFNQNNKLNSVIKESLIISSNGNIAAATNRIQKIHIFDVQDCENVYLNVEANNFYSPFYAFAFSESSVEDVHEGTNTLSEERPELTQAKTDFSFSGFIVKPGNAKTLIVQETDTKADTIKVYRILVDEFNSLKKEVEQLLPTSQKDITEQIIWRTKTFIYNSNLSYTDDNYKYSMQTNAIQYDRIKVVLPSGYNIKVRGLWTSNKIINANANNEYVLSLGNTHVEICIYLSDTSQTLTPEKLISDGVKIYGVPIFETENINYNILQRRNLPYTWMGYRSYVITDGVITALSNRNYSCIFGVQVKEGRYYRIRYVGTGSYYGFWASYAFFDSDYKSNLTALEYDSIKNSISIQSDITKKAPINAKYLMFCVQTKATNNLIFNNVDVIIEEYTEPQGLIDIASEQSVSMSMYNAGASEVPSKIKDVGIIVAGQSNAAGRCPKAEIPQGIVDEDGQIPFCNLKGVLSKNGNIDDNTPFDGIYTLQNVWAFDAIVFKKLSGKLQKNFYVAKYAIGATAIIDNGGALPCWQPDIFKITTPGKESLILKLRETINAVLSAHPNTAFKAVLWHQGEADGTSVQGAFEYYNNFKALIWYIRGIVKNPNLPFIFGTISHKSLEYSAIVEDAQKRIAEEDSNVYYVNMAEADLLDNYHFNATWANYLGEEIWKILEPLLDASVE